MNPNASPGAAAAADATIVHAPDAMIFRLALTFDIVILTSFHAVDRAFVISSSETSTNAFLFITPVVRI